MRTPPSSAPPASEPAAIGVVVNAAGAHAIERPVADEVPVALVYNGLSHVVLLATPADIEDLATGFSLTEGVLEGPRELLDIEVAEVPEGIEARLRITERRFAALKQRRRFLAGRTGCGLCGVESLAEANRALGQVSAAPSISQAAVHRALAALPAHQPLNAATGAMHAAAWVDRDGTIVLAREDIGRHNALDKLVGARLAKGQDFDDGFALLTSRCSYELVAKAASAGIGVLVAVSAPTRRALDIAVASGITVVALARADAITVFTHPDRIQP
ncbi:formate dehydrogenase accessory sulfurtransferase FdhD [Desertibaculum subflavum]|uniref:formate dehydrogenase accessory sulfurtransferase FdhD n=1 Tax=Desertibaculum subflavum TaxID=2268458 RepID=UPI000E66E922